MEFYKDHYVVSTAKEKLNTNYIHQFLSHSYRAEGIPITLVQKSIDGSMCFGVYDADKQIGFAKLATGYKRCAWLVRPVWFCNAR